ncbi:MAG TPA: hypothetical protein PKE57_03575, partial [Cellvibrionaceae bacterium]|nr:hypothetical protein [Cellvibrionaceae bacterium]
MLQFDAEPWLEYYPKPASLPVREHLARLFLNPRGNKLLFVQSCAVRLFDEQDASAVENIFLALAQAIHFGQLVPPSPEASLRWRVEQLQWETTGNLTAIPVYTSDARCVSELAALWQRDTRLCP